jgi:hypothetical protein
LRLGVALPAMGSRPALGGRFPLSTWSPR